MGENFQGFTPLVWGVKSSLISYVRGLGDGEIAVRPPAALASLGQSEQTPPQERFSFAPDPEGSHFDHDTKTGELRFIGTVIFSGHFNAMRVELCDPRLTLDGGTGTLSVRTSGRIGTPRWDAIASAVMYPCPDSAYDISVGTPRRDVIATAVMHPCPDSACDISVGLALTAAGRMLFGQQYQIGQALEPAFVETVQRALSAANHPHPRGDNNEQ